MKKKKKYDSSVIYLYNNGEENLLPLEFRKKIPHSTIHEWRNIDFSKYIGYEFRSIFKDITEVNIEMEKLNQAKKTILKLYKSWLCISECFKPLIKKARKDKKMQGEILNAINHLKDIVGLEKAIEIIGISKSNYQFWMLEKMYTCFDSYSNLCAKRVPQQLAKIEAIKMIKILEDPARKHWPIVSLQAHALKTNELVASKTTWYKYARLHGHTRKLARKRRKDVGLISNIPNEYLHTDCTYYALNEFQKVCISFVMDNYSRMILGFAVGERREFGIVKLALQRSLAIIETHPDQQDSTLVTDGGTENHNTTIDNFLARISNPKMKKIIALKHISFSNSPVEAIHKIIKGRYLRNRQFETIDALRFYLEWAVKDYNELRPHARHKLLTPYEAYFNLPLLFNAKRRVIRAKKRRILKNKCVGCTTCSGTCGKVV